VQIDVTHGDEEIRHLRNSINDLISIQALPTIWDGRESGSIVSTLLDVLVSMLQLDLAYVRLSNSNNGSPVEFVQLAQRRAPPPQVLEIGRALDRWLTNPSVNAPLVMPNPAGGGEVKIAPFRLGLTDEIGALVAGSKRANFPTPTETLLLRTAANQALVALQEARQLHEQKRAAEELERRVADRTAQLTAANEALRESEKKYRTLFDSIDEGFCTIEVLFDENDKPVDYRFLEVNPSFEKQTGIQEARGRRMREIAPQHEDHWFESYGRIALTGEPARFENQAAQLHRWYDVYGFRVGEPADRRVAILFKDITERKQAEDKIRLIINTVPGLLWTARPDGWVDFLNQRWLDYTGMTLDQGLGWAWQPGYHPDDLGTVLSKWRTALAERKPLEVEARLRRFDGEYRWFLKRAFPLFDRAERLLGWYGGNIDIHDLKRAEEKLRRIDTYLSEGQRLSHTGSWAYNILTGELVHSSEEHRRLFGFDPDKGIPSFDELVLRIHPEDRTGALREFETAVPSGKDFDAHFRIVLPDGKMKYVYGTGHPVFNPSGEVREFIGTVMDVTERKLAEEALRRSENYLAEAQKLSHTGSWARSLATGEITYWSEECYRVLGFEPHDGLLQFETFLQHVHPDDQAKVKETSETAARGRVEYEVDYRIVHPGGQLRDIHAIGHPAFSPSGDLVEYVGTVIDVTERKRAQLLLAGENRLLAMITKGDARELVLKALCRLIEELSNGSLSSILLLDPKSNQLRHGAAPSLPAAYVEAIDGLVIGPRVGSCGTAAYRAEPVIVSDIATDPLWVNYRELALAHGLRACWSTPILSSAGKVLGTFAIYYRERRSPTALDHSVIGRIVHLASIAVEREQAEAALRQAQADLAHVSRVTTMGEMTASIAHEVNQPLAAVVNNANACISLLPDGDPGLDDVREALAEIIDDAERASDVIARVRQLARKAPVERIPLDLRDVIADVMALARHESSTRRVTIHTEIPQEPPLVLGDRVQLQQVLLNLVVNGMDAMNTVEESKRVLFIRGHRQTRDGRFETLVSVQDAGTGFKPDEMGRLFEAFYTTKPQGMGMGLAISRSIIEAHGGRLWAEPNQGPGATFHFSLPFAGNAPS
jgi:hypothetical protein